MRSEHYHDTRESATCARCRSPFARERGETWRRLCIVCHRGEQDRAAFDRGYQAGRAEALREASIPPERLKALLQLAHPDRHGGSPLATSTTAWLLAQRRVGAEVTR